MAYELTAAAASSANPYAIAIAAAIDTARAAATQTQTQTGQKITQRQLSGQGFGDILSQIIGQDRGISSGQGLGSVFADQLLKRSTGIYQTVTAPTVETSQQTSKTKRSFICTELLRQGKVHPIIYLAGEESFKKLPKYTKLGYWSFADKLAKKMQKSERLSSFLAVLFRSRYLYILSGQFNLIGALMIYVGQPTCNIIGRINHGWR